MRRTLVSLPTITFLLFLSITCRAQKFNEEQQAKMNRFNAVIENPESNDTALAAAYAGLSDLFAYAGEFEAGGKLGYKLVEFTEQAISEQSDPDVLKKLSAHRATGYTAIGNLLFVEGQYEECLESIQKGFYIRKQLGDKRKIGESLNNLANTYSKMGNTALAIDLMVESLEILKEFGKPMERGIVKGNLASLYEDQGDFGSAQELLLSSLEDLAESDWIFGETVMHNELGYVYIRQGKINEAIEQIRIARSLAEENDDRNGIMASIHNMGLAFIEIGQYDSAVANLNIVKKYQEEIGRIPELSKAHCYIGKAYLRKAQGADLSDSERESALIDSKEHFQKSLEIAQELNSPRRVKFVSEFYHELLQEMGDDKAAYDMLKIFLAARDSIQNAQARNAISRIEFQKERLTTEAKHEQELAVAAEREDKQKLYTYSVAGGLGLSALFLLVVINRLNVTRKQKKVIESQKNQVEEAHKEITDSIHYAKRIQAAVLPPDSIVKQHLPGSFILYKPKDIVAGDFYWLEEKDGTVYFAAADCTGHGVPGAMVSVVCVSGLNRSLREMNITEPGKILDKTRELVVKEFEKSDEEVKDGMDIALCSLNGKTLQYAGAHNPLWIVRNGELIETKADKQPIGKYDNPQPYTTHTVELQSGDAIYIFSDGFPDQFGGEKGKKYKSGKFKQTLIDLATQPIVDQRELLDREFESWRGEHEQVDDVCVIGLKV